MDRAQGEPHRREAIAFLSSGTPDAAAALDRLTAAYGNVDPDRADVVVALGGDGLMLQVLHRFMGSGKPIYGMNRGSVGFLMNEYVEEGLHGRLAAAARSMVHPLVMAARPTATAGCGPHGPSTRCRCCGNPRRSPRCGSRSTAASA